MTRSDRSTIIHPSLRTYVRAGMMALRRNAGIFCCFKSKGNTRKVKRKAKKAGGKKKRNILNRFRLEPGIEFKCGGTKHVSTRTYNLPPTPPPSISSFVGSSLLGAITECYVANLLPRSHTCAIVCTSARFYVAGLGDDQFEKSYFTKSERTRAHRSRRSSSYSGGGGARSGPREAAPCT